MRLLYLVLYVASGAFTLFWASVFFLGSEHTAHHLIVEQGLFILFLKRFLGFSLLGGLIAVSMATISIILTALRREQQWSEPKQVFQRALLVQVLCALVGSLLFTISIFGSQAEV
ncbi:hypothetical protein [Hymenobacter seoulensis]